MTKTFLIAWLAAFIVWMGGDFGVHGAWLAPQYLALASLYRPEADQMQYIPWMLGAHVVMAAAFVWIYGRGVSAAPWMGQGVRYGIAVGCLMAMPYFIYYSIQPLPQSLVLSQVAGCFATMIVTGIVTAFFYRGSAQPAV